VYRPGIRCEGETTRKKGKITKLMFHTAAQTELLKGEEVKSLDPTAKYLVYSESMCAPNLTKLDPVEDDLTSCVLREGFGPNIPEKFGPILRNKDGVAVPGEPDDPPALLIQEDGGTDLVQLKLTPSQIVPFLEGFARVFEGYAMLLSKGFVHKDCKPGNLVAQKEPDQSWLIRIIDFGMLQKISEMNTFYFMTLFLTYPYWPFEYGLLCIEFQGRNPADQLLTVKKFFEPEGRFTKEHITNSSNDYMRPLLVDLWMESEGRIRASIVEEMTDLVVKLQDSSSNTDTMQYILKKMDVYSLGYTLGVLLYWSTGFRPGYGDHLVADIEWTDTQDRTLGFDPNDASAPLTKETDETDFQFRQREFYHSLAYSVMFPLFTLVRRMIEPRPSLRISIDDALETYRTILPTLRSSVMRNTNAVRMYSAFAKATHMGESSPRTPANSG
jgi:serine/threonine protein kinase